MSKRLIPRSKLSNRQLNRLIDFFAPEHLGSIYSDQFSSYDGLTTEG